MSESLRALLRRALAAVEDGDAGGGERVAKAVSAIVRAELDIAALAAATPPSQQEDEEILRAELRRRVARFVDATQAGSTSDALQRIGTEEALE